MGYFRVACRNGIAADLVRMRCIESVTRFKCVASHSSLWSSSHCRASSSRPPLFISPLSPSSLPHSPLSLVVRSLRRWEGARIFIDNAAENPKRLCAAPFPPTSSDARSRARVNRYWKHGRGTPCWLEFLNIQRCITPRRARENMRGAPYARYSNIGLSLTTD